MTESNEEDTGYECSCLIMEDDIVVLPIDAQKGCAEKYQDIMNAVRDVKVQTNNELRVVHDVGTKILIEVQKKLKELDLDVFLYHENHGVKNTRSPDIPRRPDAFLHVDQMPFSTSTRCLSPRRPDAFLHTSKGEKATHLTKRAIASAVLFVELKSTEKTKWIQSYVQSLHDSVQYTRYFNVSMCKLRPTVHLVGNGLEWKVLTVSLDMTNKSKPYTIRKVACRKKGDTSPVKVQEVDWLVNTLVDAIMENHVGYEYSNVNHQWDQREVNKNTIFKDGVDKQGRVYKGGKVVHNPCWRRPIIG